MYAVGGFAAEVTANCKEGGEPAAQFPLPPRAPPVLLACAGGAPLRSKKIRLVQCDTLHTALIADTVIGFPWGKVPA